MVPQVHDRKRMRTLLLSCVAALVLGVTGIAIPRGNVTGMGGGGLVCGYFIDPATGTTQAMGGSYFVGRKRWLREPIADVATVTLAAVPIAGGSPDIMPKADCVDIARQAMLRDAATCNIPDAAALVESALTSPAGAAEHASWWRYLVATLRIVGPVLTILGCVGLLVFLLILQRRRRRAAIEGSITLCAYCGYQLAGLLAHTESERGAVLTLCPECGKPHSAEPHQAEHPLAAPAVALLPVLVFLIGVALAAMTRWQF